MWVALALPAAAQEQMPVLDDRYVAMAWGTEHGLPLAHTTHAAYGPDGLLWVSSFDGLVRFDGRTFHDVPDSDALPSQRVGWVFATSDDAVWVGLEGGTIARYVEGQFENVTERFGLPAWADAGAEVSPGVVWLPMGSGLWRVTEGTAQPVAPSTLRGYVGPPVRTQDGSWWAYTSERAIRRRPDGSLQQIRIDRSELTPTAGWGGTPEADRGALWRCHPDGVIRFDGRRFVLAARPPDLGGQAHQFVSAVSIAEQGLLCLAIPKGSEGKSTWVAFDGTAYRVPPGLDGVLGEFHPTVRSGTVAWRVLDGYLEANGEPVVHLGPLDITRLLPDGDGGVWVAGPGLWRVRPRPVVSVAGGEVGNTYPILAGTDGRVWAGSWRPEALVQIEAGRTVRSYPKPARASALFQAEDGELWIGYYGAGGLQLQRWRSPGLGEPESVPFDSTYVGRAFAEDRAGWLWMGHGGGALLKGPDDVWRPVLRGVPVIDVEPLPNGEVLLATQGRGIGRATRAGVLEWFGEAEGLASNNVRDITIGDGGVLWIATQDNGLCRLGPSPSGPLAAGALACFGLAEGLPDLSLHRLLPDSAGRLWSSTNRGVFWLDREEADAAARDIAAGRPARLTPVLFTDRHGMPDSEANGAHQPAGTLATDGRLYIPTQGGIAVFDTRAIGRPQPPTARVLSATRGDAPVTVGAGRIELGPGEQEFSVEFTAVAFDHPESVQYRVMLDGYDSGWRDPGLRREAIYTSLPPGRYTFRVQAGLGGVWGPVDEVRVVLAPQWWETWWFRLGGVLSGAVALAALAHVATRARIRSFERRQRELEATVSERTAELRRVNEAKTRFLLNVSHELRTPLALLLGPLDDLRKGRFEVDPRAQPLLDHAATSGRRLRRLIEDLLTLARLDAEAVELRRQRGDLVAFTRTRAAAFESRAQDKGVALTVDAPPDEVCIAFDPSHLETAVYNVLSNAIKFTPAGGRVTVRVRPDGDGAEITVRDTGPGVAPDDLGRLFERFYQGDTEPARRGEGTGIGLAIVREFVELHGGTVGLESEFGRGTTLTMRLPHGEADVPASSIPASRPGLAHADVDLWAPDSGDGASPAADLETEDLDDDRPLVLVVEDHPDLRAYLQTHLAPHYRVAEAADGAEGITRALDLVPDLVLSDVMMPGIDGFGVLAALKRDFRTSHVPVVLLTARADAESRLEGFGGGADDYLTKPFDADVLLARVSNLIAQRRALLRLWTGAEAAPVPDTAPTAEPLPPAEAAFLERIDAAITGSMSDPSFGVTALAEAVAMSPRQLRRKLAALTDESPIERLRRRRVERAAGLMADEGLAVKEAMWAVGFTSGSGFRTAFHDVLGVSPADYASADKNTPEA